MYERFTDRSRKVMQLANQEAQCRNHEYIGTEHILLGLIREGSGVGANVLKNLDMDLRKIAREIDKIVQSGPDMVTMGKLPQTPRAKKVIEYSIEEARNLNHNYVGTEHLLLGLLREQEGVAAQVLVNLGLKLEDVREEVLNLLGHNLDRGDAAKPGASPRARKRRGEEPKDLPGHVREALRELNERIGQLAAEKEEAVAGQDFERAAHLRDQEDKLIRQRDELARTWQGTKAERLREYELYVPLAYPDGSLVEPERLAQLRERLTQQFGGVGELRLRIEGAWQVGNVTLRGEVAAFRVFSRSTAPVAAFFAQLKNELRTELRSENVVIVTRSAEVL